MRTLRMITLTTAVALVGCLTTSTAVSSAGIVDQVVPLKTKVVTTDGKKKIKLAKKLPVLVSCSKDCSFKATMTVVTPDASYPKSLKGKLAAGNILTLSYKLTEYGLSYVKEKISGSKMKVKLSAKDSETGERVVKTRTFRFYR